MERNNSLTILGGGLWGGLLAYRLRTRRPDVRFKLIEKEDAFGGNHTWSFHETDLAPEALRWIRPFVTRSWPGYHVDFPAYRKEVKAPYHTITAKKFNQILQSTLAPESYSLGKPVSAEDLRTDAGLVFDARNRCQFLAGGYQKFVGLEVRLREPHGLTLPVLMDAKVEQVDGYRFIYYLPFSHDTILVEDTRYSNLAHLDVEAVRDEVLELISSKGWVVEEVLREESGSLPIPYSSATYHEAKDTINLAGIFHDTTGYSLPDAVRVIDRIAASDLTFGAVEAIVSDYRFEREKNRGFFRTLNQLLFEAAIPDQRYRIFEHFYQLSPGLIERFYRGELGALDKVRIFVGKPPVPVNKAMQILLNSNNRWAVPT